VLGTRGSQLALSQANVVKSKLEAEGHRVVVETISTRGDEHRNEPISEIGDEAVFTKEIDHALLAGDIHVAVHSLKDIPSTLPPGIVLAAVGSREDPRDAFVAHPSFEGQLADLPKGATLATASLRRTAQLRTWRSDLEVVPVRGNVDTRLEKLEDSDWDGVVLAVAGLLRMGLSARIRERMEPSLMLPAVGQGALGIACAASDERLRARLHNVLHHTPSGYAAMTERAFLREVQGGCQVPLGAWAQMPDQETLTLDACVAGLHGEEYYRDQRAGAPEDADELGRALASDLLDAGADAILNRVLGDRPQRASPFRP